MISIEEMQIMLDDIADSFPPAFYEELNGGIILLSEAKKHEKSSHDDLFILGQYHRGGSMGRYISVYYGSFMRVYGQLENAQIIEKLSNTVKHEFRHHIESLAGERDLEIIDSDYIAEYLTGKDHACKE